MLAYCPGHITGFFKIEDKQRDRLKRGSRGVGFCVETGAYSEVQVKKADKTKISIMVNGKKSCAPVTRIGIECVLPKGHWLVNTKIWLDAPVGQGFGMSAAGTFASCLAIAETLGIRYSKKVALRATHMAEVRCKTGLGDAVAQSLGGVVHRLAPGVPPFGKLKKLPYDDDDLIICILGKPIKTANILGSEEKRARVNKAGSRALLRFSESGSGNFSDFIHLSWDFAKNSKLATEKMERVLDTVSEIGKGSMVMLGNAVFAFGDSNALASQLRRFGPIIKTRIASSGPSICW